MIDEAVLGPLDHLDDLALDPLDPAFGADLAQILAVQDGVEMIGGVKA